MKTFAIALILVAFATFTGLSIVEWLDANFGHAAHLANKIK